MIKLFRICCLLMAFVIGLLCGIGKGYRDGFDKGWDDRTAIYERTEAEREQEAKAQEQAAVTAEPVRLPVTVTYLPQVQMLSGEVERAPEGTVLTDEPCYTDDDVYCLAAAIYQEAGSDACSDETRYMVADVILNRMEDERFPDSIREVLEQYMQYGMFWSTGVQFPARAEEEPEREAVKRAWETAYDVLSGTHSELYGNGYVFQAEFIQGSEYIFRDGIYFGK